MGDRGKVLSILLGLMMGGLGCADGSTTTVVQRAMVGQDLPEECQGCPSGWSPDACVAIRCASGYELETRSFGDASCSRCKNAPQRTCNGPWIPAAAEVRCAYGQPILSQDGLCQRCPKVSTGSCGDCMPTGCSGQYCGSEPIFSTCEYKAEYGCYQDLGNCGCFANGGTACGWEQTDELAQCIEDAQSVKQL